MRSRRLKEWREVLEEEQRDATWRDRWQIVWSIFRHSLKLAIGYRRHRKTFWIKMRTCRKCPVYDKTMKRCRPYTGAEEGCGCYTPFLALSTDECWMDQNGGYGWTAAIQSRGVLPDE